MSLEIAKGSRVRIFLDGFYPDYQNTVILTGTILHVSSSTIVIDHHGGHDAVYNVLFKRITEFEKL